MGVKTTVEIPDQLLRQTKAAAALRGQSMKEFITAALQERCRLRTTATQESGWRVVFGRGKRAQVARVAKVVDKEFSRVDDESWR